jgi:ParB/RepB/Spo0J family partition protein
MPASNEFHLLPPSAINVDRERRQRREISLEQQETKNLCASIRARGILSPLVLRRDNFLVAGERRLVCALELQLPVVPVHYLDELDPFEAEVAELEENVQRSDLSWQEQVRAVHRLHILHKAKDPTWSGENTANLISFSKSFVNRMLQIAGYAATHPEAWKFDTMSRAGTAADRYEQRAFATALDKIHEIPDDILLGTSKSPKPTIQQQTEDGQAPRRAPGSSSMASTQARDSGTTQSSPAPTEQPVLQANFLEFARSYEGPKFNFLHCDFPYGIGIDRSDQLATGDGARASYSDTSAVYWDLVSALVENADRLLLPSAHCMFWFSMLYYQETFDALSKVFRVDRFPLLWHKSDGKGLLPDPNRGPRRIYETAFSCSRGDRFIVKPVANAISAPTAKSFHVSCKPVPVLRHFFTMYVDEHTEMLDPTCGSASSLIAAEHAKAERVLGLELDPKYVGPALHEVTAARNLRRLNAVVNKLKGPEVANVAPEV